MSIMKNSGVAAVVAAVVAGSSLVSPVAAEAREPAIPAKKIPRATMNEHVQWVCEDYTTFGLHTWTLKNGEKISDCNVAKGDDYIKIYTGGRLSRTIRVTWGPTFDVSTRKLTKKDISCVMSVIGSGVALVITKGRVARIGNLMSFGGALASC